MEPEFVIPERWMTTNDVAKMLNVTARTVEYWRRTDKGPPYTKMGSVRYKREDVLAWLTANTVTPSKSNSRREDAA